METAGNRHAHCYGAYQVSLGLTDGWGQTRDFDDVFYAIEGRNTPIILGMPGMQLQHIWLDTAGTR